MRLMTRTDKNRSGGEEKFGHARRLVVQEQAEQDRGENHLRGGEKNAPRIDGHVGAGQPTGEQRGHDHGGQRRAHGQEDGEGDIGPGEVGHEIRGRAPRAAGDEDESDGERPGQGEHLGHAPAEDWHDGYCAAKPRATAPGRRSTAAKSPVLRVSPMPSMTRARPPTIQGPLNQVKSAGCQRARRAAPRTQAGNQLAEARRRRRMRAELRRFPRLFDNEKRRG
jgi:hypothetical protein